VKITRLYYPLSKALEIKFGTDTPTTDQALLWVMEREIARFKAETKDMTEEGAIDHALRAFKKEPIREECPHEFTPEPGCPECDEWIKRNS
jgi:hypothetical protein